MPHRHCDKLRFGSGLWIGRALTVDWSITVGEYGCVPWFEVEYVTFNCDLVAHGALSSMQLLMSDLLINLKAVYPLAMAGEGWFALVVAAVILFGLITFWPRRGLYPFWKRISQKSQRVMSEDALKHIFNTGVEGEHASLASLAGALQLPLGRTADLLADMEKRGLITYQGGILHLTPDGKRYALHIIRAHRLWERYLAEETGYAAKEWHRRAERLEHDLTPDQVEALNLKLNRPSHDPHGDPIPTADGQTSMDAGQPLTRISVDGLARIIHLEDEPASIYVQLIALGLQPGMELRVLDKSDSQIRFWAGGDEHVLATMLANSVTVTPVEEMQLQPPLGEPLGRLQIGQQARVLGLSPQCHGAERRRLLDLGFVPGALVEAAMISPSGDPTAYRIRGTLIALRHEQANFVRTVPEEQGVVA